MFYIVNVLILINYQNIISKNYFLEKNHEDLNLYLKDYIVAENYLAAKNDLLLGADINHLAHCNGRSILHIAAIAYKPTIEMVKFLVENGASNLHHKDNFGKSPLYYLLIANRFDVAEFMIRELKAEIHQKDFADKPREICTSDKSIDFEEIIKWCKNLSLKLKTEQTKTTEVFNDLHNGNLNGTYFNRFSAELIKLLSKQAFKGVDNSEFFHRDDSTVYTPNADFNDNNIGSDANICLSTYDRISVSGATNDNNSASCDMSINF